MKNEVRNGHPYWIWESIMETPDYLDAYLEPAFRGEVDRLAEKIVEYDPRKIVIAGTGSSNFVSLAEASVLGQILGLQINTYVTSELLGYSIDTLDNSTLCLFNSHSGESVGDVESTLKAKEMGALTLGITDISNSSLAKAVDVALVGPGGPKHELPATRSYSSALFRVILLGLAIAKKQGKNELFTKYQKAIQKIPGQIRKVLANFENQANACLCEFTDCSAFFVVGSGPNIASAHEGALGLSQSAEVPATAFPTENFLHGPIQILSKEMGVVVIAAPGPRQVRLLQTAKAAKMIGSKVLILQPENLEPHDFADFTILFPADIPELLTPLVYISPLWQLGYFFSLNRGHNADKLSMEKEEFQEALAYLMKGDAKFGG